MVQQEHLGPENEYGPPPEPGRADVTVSNIIVNGGDRATRGISSGIPTERAHDRNRPRDGRGLHEDGWTMRDDDVTARSTGPGSTVSPFRERANDHESICITIVRRRWRVAILISRSSSSRSSFRSASGSDPRAQTASSECLARAQGNPSIYFRAYRRTTTGNVSTSAFGPVNCTRTGD